MPQHAAKGLRAALFRIGFLARRLARARPLNGLKAERPDDIGNHRAIARARGQHRNRADEQPPHRYGLKIAPVPNQHNHRPARRLQFDKRPVARHRHLAGQLAQADISVDQPADQPQRPRHILSMKTMANNLLSILADKAPTLPIEARQLHFFQIDIARFIGNFLRRVFGRFLRPLCPVPHHRSGPSGLLESHQFFRRRGVHRNGRIKLRLGRAHGHGDAESLNHLAAIRPDNVQAQHFIIGLIDNQLHQRLLRIAGQRAFIGRKLVA
jgi:hypothetical protein